MYLVRESTGEIQTNYTRKYAETRGWGIFQVVREVVQNALDETEAVHIEKTPEGLLITDKGNGFNVLNLLMGTTTKQGSKCMRGRYGEGLKIAMLTAMDNDYGVDIVTGSMHIMPEWKTITVDDPSQGKLSAQIMIFKYEKVPAIKGTRVLIKNYTGDTYEERFNLITNKKIIFRAQTDTCGGKPYSSYMIDEDPKCLYVRNIFVKEVSEMGKLALYSYDLYNVALSTDRNIPNNYDVLTQVGVLWSHVENPGLIEQFFTAVDKGSNMLENQVALSSHTMTKQHTENAWVAAFKKHYGANTFLSTNSNLTRLAEYHTRFMSKGVNLPENIRDTLTRIGIQDDEHVLLAIKSRIPLVPTPKSLTPQQIDNLEYVRAIHYTLKNKYFPQLNRVFAATEESMMDSLGKAIDDKIYIRADQLSKLLNSVDIYGHEATHIIYPELDDNTSAFYAKIGQVMATITKVIVVDMKDVKPPKNIEW